MSRRYVQNMGNAPSINKARTKKRLNITKGICIRSHRFELQ